MATITFTETNTVNFPSPAIPDFDDPSEVEEKFTSVYGNTEFAFTVIFSVESTDEQASISVISVETISKPSFMLSQVLSSNSIRLTKNPDEELFSDEYYEYVTYSETWETTLEQFSFSQEPPDETSIIEWKQPDIKIINDSYTFRITYTEDLVVKETTITIPQTFYWNYVPSLNKFIQEVAESEY